MCVDIYEIYDMHMYMSSLCQMRGLKRTNTPVAMSTLYAQLLVSNTISNERNQGFLEKWLIPGLTNKYTEGT